MPWFNSDGLNIRFANEKINPKDPRGESPGAGPYREIECVIDLTKGVAAANNKEWGLVIPSNSFVVKVRTLITTAITGASGYTFGLEKYDGTELDYDGLLVSLPALTIGTEVTVVKGGTGAGALLGTKTTQPGIFSYTPTGTALTGKILVSVGIIVTDKAPAVLVY